MSTIEMTVKQLDRWLKRQDITSTELAVYLNLSKHAISKWRERNTIPRKLRPVLEELVESDRRSLQRHLRRPSVSLFE